MATSRRGFTLTELLVVITIIAILASLGTVAVMRAMTTARATAIKTELDQIDAALKRYKDQFGSYPPCNLAFAESGISSAEQQRRLGQLRQHLSMAFPRYTADAARIRRDLTAAGIDVENFRPDQALVFWLQGFSSDPTNPILSVDSRVINPSTGAVDPASTVQKRANNFFEFEVERLVGVESGSVTNPAPSYFPTNARLSVNQVATKRFPEYVGGGVPVIYFDSRDYEQSAAVVGGAEAKPRTFNSTSPPLFADAGFAAPYWQDKNANGRTNLAADADAQESWINPDSFQLIAAGQDHKYFVINPMPTLPMDAHLFPTGTRIDVITEGDNSVNFTSTATLGDELP